MYRNILSRLVLLIGIALTLGGIISHILFINGQNPYSSTLRCFIESSLGIVISFIGLHIGKKKSININSASSNEIERVLRAAQEDDAIPKTVVFASIFFITGALLFLITNSYRSILNFRFQAVFVIYTIIMILLAFLISKPIKFLRVITIIFFCLPISNELRYYLNIKNYQFIDIFRFLYSILFFIGIVLLLIKNSTEYYQNN